MAASLFILLIPLRFSMVATSATCPQPPATFNVLTATDSAIDYFGMPKRPHDPAQLQRYVAIWNRPWHRVCGSGKQFSTTTRTVTPFEQHIKPAFNEGNYYSPNWSGVMGFPAPGYNDNFQWATGQFTINCTSSTAVYNGHTYDASYSQWVGLGGVYGNGDLWQAGWDGIKDIFWWEQVGGPNDTKTEQSFFFGGPWDCGNQGYVYVDQDLTFSTGTFASVADLTTNQYSSLGFDNNYADTHSADWIDERPSCGGSNRFYELANYNNDLWSNAFWGYTNGISDNVGSGYYYAAIMQAGNELSQPYWIGSTEFQDFFDGYTTSVQC